MLDNQQESAPPPAGLPAAPFVEARDISKRFGGIQALDRVNLVVYPGAVHGLVGENGAGKSTLSKIIGGLYQPDGGELLLAGRPVRFGSPRDALAAGIATIAQELALVPARTVAENVFLGAEPRAGGVLNNRELRRRFDELNERAGFNLPANRQVRDLRTAEQQKVEILRAMARNARLILMDEPTASLTADETQRLLTTIRQLAAAGTAIVLVSHFLDEVLAVSDQVTAMRDGKVVRTAPASAETPDSLVQAMIGRKLELAFPEPPPVAESAPVVLRVDDLTRRGLLDQVSFEIRAGEILGLAGLVGSGRTEVARAIFGADRLDRGQVFIDGRPIAIRHPGDAMRAGIAMLPESRKEQGLFLDRAIRENATIADLNRFARGGVVQRRQERAAAAGATAALDVRMRSIEAPVITLSGGNQQKVLFAKWLLRRPRVLLADEPTRGVDVGAKRQIYDLVLRLAAEGMAVLLISSEIEEVLGLSHRVLVLRNGRLVAEFPRALANRDDVMNAAFQPTRSAAGGAVA